MKPVFLDWLRRWRALAVAAVIGILFAIGAGGLWWWQGRNAERSVTSTRLSANDPDRWRVAGRHYLEKYPEEASSEKLAQLILEGTTPAASADEAVQALIRDDIAKKRTVVIDGWVLSRTEARLAALAALMADATAPSVAPEGVQERRD